MNNAVRGSFAEPYGHSNTRVLKNNIILEGTIDSGLMDAGSEFEYTMSNSDQLPQGNGNVTNVDMTTVFVDTLNNVLTEACPVSPAYMS